MGTNVRSHFKSGKRLGGCGPASSPSGEMMSLREKVKESLWTLCGIGLLILLLAIYNGPNLIIPELKRVYLHHLSAKEGAANGKVESAFTQNQCNGTQPIDAFLACMKKFTDDLTKAVNEKSPIHQQRLWLEVKWDFADSSEDVKELGWNYPRALWDGNNWSCPPGTSPYSIEAERKAGAVEYVHCLSEKEVAEHAR